MNQLISFRVNHRLEIEPRPEHLFVPMAEIIILIEKPEYSIKKGTITKASRVGDLRFNTDEHGLTALIEELTKTRDNLLVYGQFVDKACEGQKFEVK